MTLRIVTDSACDIPPDIAEKLNITVVPVYINVGTTSYLDGVELSHEAFFEQLPTYPTVPTTAAPSPGAFAAAYQALADEGVDQILSLHISAELSATHNVAKMGAEEISGATVTHFNTKQLTLGSGLLAIMAAEAAAEGQSLETILDMLNAHVDQTRIYAAIATLEYMRRSGRVNWATFGIGTLLQIKPVVTLYQSEVTIAERVRTFKKSVRKMMALVEAAAPLVRIAILHSANPDAADALASAVAEQFPDVADPIISEIGPAIGAHVGPGSVGIAFVGAP